MKKLLILLSLPILLGTTHLHCDESKDIALAKLTSNIRVLFDMTGTRTQDDNKVRIQKSIDSFSDVYEAIYARLAEDPKNRSLKKKFSKFNKHVNTLEINLCMLLQSVEDGEVNHRAADRVFSSLEKLKDHVEESTIIENPLKVKFVKSIKVILITATAIVSVMVINKIHNMLKPDKREEMLKDALHTVEDGMTDVAEKARRTMDAASAALDNTRETLSSTLDTAAIVDNMGDRVEIAMEDHEGRLRSVEQSRRLSFALFKKKDK